MRIRYRVDAKEVIQAFRRAPDVMTRALGLQIDRGLIEVSREARRLAPKAFSILTNSIFWRRTRPLSGFVSQGVNYGGAVEKGSGPGGMPPKQTLLRWIRLQRIEPREPGTSFDQLAFLIGRSIASKGTKAQPHMGPALENKRSRVETLLAMGVSDGLRQVGLA